MARQMKDSGIAWIGEIPAEWGTVKIKYTSWLKGRIGWQGLTSAEYIDEGPYLVTGTDFASGIVNWNTCVHISKERFEMDADIQIREGDLLITKDGTVGKVAIARNCPQEVSLNSGILLIRNVGRYKYYDRYLYYVLISDEFWRWYTLSQTGQSTIKHLYQEQFYNFEFAFPECDEQRRIADFLDAECARIDAVIEKTRASIEEYKKLKQSVITEVVTKGIRPGRKMKDSGIEWIGEIPEEWSVRRIKTIFGLRDERNYLPLEEVNLISLYTDVGVVQHSDLEKTTGNKASNADGYKIVHENDIIVNIILCWMGAIGRSAYSGVTSPAYDIYVPSDEIECRFYHHYFRTTGFSGDCYKRGKGIMAMRWRTYSDQFRDIRVVVPPIEEQREILAYLDSKTAEIDALIAKKEQLLAEMDSYKKSIIFEYVTGKKEVI